MRYIKLYENFQQKEYMGLDPEQEEDLRVVFWEIVTNNDLDYKSAMEYFKPDSQTFANFLKELEQETNWFDYTQMELVFEDISIYLMELEQDEDSDSDESE